MVSVKEHRRRIGNPSQIPDRVRSTRMVVVCFSLQGLALFPDLSLPLIGVVFSEGCHHYNPPERACS